MEKLKYIKIEHEDGTLSENVPIGADATNVDYNNTTVKAELDKINTIDSSLINTQASQETKLVNLQTQVNGLASGSPLVASSTSEMTDTTRVYVNTSDGHWYYNNGTEWISGGVYQSTQVSYEKNQFGENSTSFIKNNQSNLENIYNMDNSLNGFFIGNNGVLEEHVSYFTSDFLPIEENETYYINKYIDNVFVGFYDISKKFISRIYNVNEFTTPEKTAYYRISTVKSIRPDLIVIKGNSVPDVHYGYTNYIKGFPILYHIPYLKLLRGSITISNVDRTTNTIELNVSEGTIVYNENGFAVVPAGKYKITGNKQAILYNVFSKQFETQLLDIFTEGFTQTPKAYNGLYYVGYLLDGIMYHNHMKQFEVNKKGFLTYEKISDVLKIINSFTNKNIYVAEGEYEDEIHAWNYEINIIGENAEKTIIYNTSGNYSTPALEMGAGTIKDITVYAKYNGTNPTQKWSAYAMHVETNNLANKKLICKNVIFKSDFNYCVGIGLRKGADLEFNNCKFINNCDYTNDNITIKGGAIYFHDNYNNEYAGECSIAFINCLMTMKGTTESSNMPLIRLQQVEPENTYPVHVTFINNSTMNKALNNSGTIWNTGHTGSIDNGDWLSMKDWKLTLYSHGNNYDVLNY